MNCRLTAELATVFFCVTVGENFLFIVRLHNHLAKLYDTCTINRIGQRVRRLCLNVADLYAIKRVMQQYHASGMLCPRL